MGCPLFAFVSPLMHDAVLPHLVMFAATVSSSSALSLSSAAISRRICVSLHFTGEIARAVSSLDVSLLPIQQRSCRSFKSAGSVCYAVFVITVAVK